MKNTKGALHVWSACMFCLYLCGCLGISEMDNKPLLTKKMSSQDVGHALTKINYIDPQTNIKYGGQGATLQE